MLPIKDNIPTDRLPLVTLLLIAGAAAAFVVRGDWLLPVDAAFLWIFGPNVEDAMSRPRFAAFCALAGGAAVGVEALLDPGTTPIAAGVAGTTAAAIAAHLVLHRRARVVTMLLVPLAFTLIELPSWLLAGCWVALQVVLAATTGGGWATFAAQAAGFAFGLLAVHAFAQRRKQAPPTPDQVPALP